MAGHFNRRYDGISTIDCAAERSREWAGHKSQDHQHAADPTMASQKLHDAYWIRIARLVNRLSTQSEISGISVLSEHLLPQVVPALEAPLRDCWLGTRPQCCAGASAALASHSILGTPVNCCDVEARPPPSCSLMLQSKQRAVRGHYTGRPT